MSSALVFSRPGGAPGQPQRGDVVDIQPDDAFDWGRDIMPGPQSLGWWQVVAVTGGSLASLGALTEAGAEADRGTPHWQYRVWSVDLDALGSGQPEGAVWTVSLEDVLRCVSRKPNAGRATFG